MQEFITQYFGEFITAMVGGFAGWFYQRSKEKSDLQSNEIDNAEKVLKYYREMIDDLALRLKQAIEELNEAKQMVKGLKAKEESLIRQLKRYEGIVGKLGEHSKDIQQLKDEASSTA